MLTMGHRCRTLLPVWVSNCHQSILRCRVTHYHLAVAGNFQKLRMLLLSLQTSGFLPSASYWDSLVFADVVALRKLVILSRTWCDSARWHILFFAVDKVGLRLRAFLQLLGDSGSIFLTRCLGCDLCSSDRWGSYNTDKVWPSTCGRLSFPLHGSITFLIWVALLLLWLLCEDRAWCYTGFV